MIHLIYVVLLFSLVATFLFVRDLIKEKDLSRKNTSAYTLLLFALFLLFFIGQSAFSDRYVRIIFNSITAIRDVLFLKFNYELIEEAFVSSLAYSVTYVLTLVVTYIYIARLVIVLFIRRFSDQLKIRKLIKEDVTIIIGDGLEARAFIKENKGAIILWDKAAKDAGVPVYRGEVTASSFKYLAKHKNVEFLTFLSQEESVLLANFFVASLEERDFTESNIFLTIVIEHSYTQVYDSIIEKGRGLIKVINKYDVIAKEMIKRHPLSKYLDEALLLPNGALQEEAAVQVILIGYGRVNQEIYLKTVMNSQFATIREGALITKPVNYYIIEKEDKQYNKELNHTLFRVDNTEFDHKNYLPMPEKIHQTTYQKIDINAREFYLAINEIAKRPQSKTFIYVSIDNDLENLDIALKLKEHIKYYDLENVVLFVRIQDYSAVSTLFSVTAELSSITVFGSYSDYITKDVLFDRHLDQAAIQTAIHYEEKSTHKEKEVLLKPRHTWSKLSVYKQDSNRYAILNINFKLNLLGFTVYDEQCALASKNDFHKVYDPKDEQKTWLERTNYHLTEPFYTRDVMAFIEHSRWNAFHLAHGYIPLEKDLITLNSNKVPSLKLHGCLTTFSGLSAYHDHLAAQITDPKMTLHDKLRQVDVIKYDYSTLDELDENLRNIGEKLRLKQNK